MENGKNKVTTKKQFEKLVELMEKFPEVGRGKSQFGNSKFKIKELWESVALQLNCLGPPSTTAYEWGRVWIHYKASLKKKLANRNNYIPCDWWWTVVTAVAEPNGGERGPAYSIKGSSCTKWASIWCGKYSSYCRRCAR